MSVVLKLARSSLTLVALVAIAGCAGPGRTSEPPIPTTPAGSAAPSAVASAAASATPSSDAISIKGFAFAPDDLKVPVGTTVTWTNDEDAFHTVTSGSPASPSGLFDSGEIDTGVEFSFIFTDEGTYPFFCSRHDFMKGVVTVTP
jgi:plastocyanin